MTNNSFNTRDTLAVDGTTYTIRLDRISDSEAAFHKTVNSALTSTLIPSAKNPELKAFLETGLKTFQGCPG